jgi:Xaa-Pro aminopeptidase
LIDAGARYAGYAADMTRTFPVNGRFTKRQKEVYRAVQNIFLRARKLFVPGTSFAEYHAAVDAFADETLVELGLLSMSDLRNQHEKHPARSAFFLHKTSHSLGLDVHDPGDNMLVFAPGMVFTCEPGIYLRDEALGIRLENNLVITENGCEDLMDGFPMDPEEIESLMHEN